VSTRTKYSERRSRRPLCRSRTGRAAIRTSLRPPYRASSGGFHRLPDQARPRKSRPRRVPVAAA
jgi:hypothetical protein